MASPSAHGISRRTLLAASGALGMVSAGMLAGCRRRARAPDIAVVGSSPTGVPFSFVDPWSNELTGSMIDTARVVAARAGIAIELQITPFAALIPSLLARKIDVIAAALLRTAEREKIAAFSRPIYAYGAGVVVPRTDTGVYPDVASLVPLRLGVQAGTRFVEQLRAAGAARVRTYENLSDILRDLAHGRIDAAYGDAPILAYQLRSGARPTLRMASTFKPPGQETLCFVFRLGDPLLPRFDAAIDSLGSAEIPAIARRWHLT